MLGTSNSGSLIFWGIPIYGNPHHNGDTFTILAALQIRGELEEDTGDIVLFWLVLCRYYKLVPHS